MQQALLSRIMDMPRGRCMLVYNVDFLIAGMLFLIVILGHFLHRPTMHLVNNRSFIWTLVISILYILVDIVCTILITQADLRTKAATEICVMLLCMLQILVPHAFMWHVQNLTERNDTSSLLTISTRYVLPVFMCSLVFLNHWSHIFFHVDRAGNYTRGPFYNGLYMLAGVYVFLILYYTFSSRSKISRNRKKSIMELFCYALAAVTIQFFIPNLLLAGFGVALGITVLFLTINNPYNYTDTISDSFDIRYLEEVYKSAHKQNMNMYFVSVTITQMKRLNRIIGMKKGNELLKYIAREFRASSRSITVFRAGRRFIIACPSLTSLCRTAATASDLFSRDIRIDDENIRVTAAIAVVDDTRNIASSDELLSYMEFISNTCSQTETTTIRSSKELYNRFSYYQEIENYLDEAIGKDLFSVNYQPIWDTRKERYTSVECLSRLSHPRLGNVPPYIFIQLAERNDQINRIGILQIRRICRFLQENPVLLEKIDSFKINLSPAELMREGHVEKLIGIIEEYNLPRSFFQFEITETVATEYGEALNEVIGLITGAGIGLSLDDFGSGYANLNSVLKLPFSSVKLDKSMLSGLEYDRNIRTLYRSTVSTLHEMDYQIVAEGVESEEEKDLATNAGVDLIQGYYYSRPLPEDKLVSLLES